MAEKLYVSRTAVSKWESGKGYPNIDSLKDIARLFNITVDDLLSSEEILDIAQKENTFNIKRVKNLMYGLLDIISVLFIFLPLYAYRTENFVYSVSLFQANDINGFTKAIIIVILSVLSLIGVAELVLHFVENQKVRRILNASALIVGILSILFFILSRQTYLTLIIFILWIVKVFIGLKGVFGKK